MFGENEVDSRPVTKMTSTRDVNNFAKIKYMTFAKNHIVF